MLTIELIAVPNHTITVTINEGQTVGDALNTAGGEWPARGQNHEIRMNGQLVTVDSVLTGNADLYLTQRVKGNESDEI